MGELSKLINKYNKKNPGSIISAKDIPYEHVPRISTGSLSLDIAIGGGIPYGSIVEMFGEESTGKSLLALKAVIEAQKLGMASIYIDLEGTFTKAWAKKVGVDLNLFHITSPNTAEEALQMAVDFSEIGEVAFVIIDSVAALCPAVEVEEEVGKQTMGLAAKLLSKACRKLVTVLKPKGDQKEVSNYNKTSVIFINQTREKIGVMYGSPLVTPGGKAIKFYSSIRLHIKRGEPLKEKTKLIGQEIKVLAKKNKTFKPNQVASFKFYYEDASIDNEESIVDYAIIYNLISQSGAWFYFGEEKFQGKDKLKEYLKQQPDILKSLFDDIKVILEKE